MNKKLETSKEQKTKDESRKTRGVHLNYHHLNNPFSDKDKINADDPKANILFALTTKTKDKYCSIKKAHKSLEWPDWEKGIVTKLNQL